MNTYVAGALVRTIANFTDVNGNNADPTTTTVKYILPGGTVQTPTPVHDSTGNFHYDIDTSGVGGGFSPTAEVEWKGTGAVQAIAVDQFLVTPAPL